MKKPYQIEAQRAVKRLEGMAAEGNPAVQMVLPMAEMMGWLRKGVGELIRQAGLQLIGLLMDEEVRQVVGERHRPQADRKASRWGSEQGYCIVMGQKVPIQRPRVRTSGNQEMRLGSYELFHRGEPLTETVWEKLLLGLSTRNYGKAVREFTEAYGLEKKRGQRTFHRGQPDEVEGNDGAPAGKDAVLRLAGRCHAVRGTADGGSAGHRLRWQENDSGHPARSDRKRDRDRRVAGDLVSRGLDFTVARLYVLDGAKALTAAVKKHAGENALIQRCQVHKRRNVLAHLTEEQQPLATKKLNAAYALEDYAAAKQALTALHRELMDLNPSAARSLAEGLEETLTVHRLRVPVLLRQTLASTNVIESAFSVVERVCKNVKRWHGGDQRERWVGSGLLVAEKQFKRIKGYRQITFLLKEMEALTPSQKVVVKRRKAS